MGIGFQKAIFSSKGLNEVGDRPLGSVRKRVWKLVLVDEWEGEWQ